MLETLINNWQLLVVGIAFLILIIVAIYNFILLPDQKKFEKVRQWLLWAVVEAEKRFGGGTGQVKLRYVYDLFITRYPLISKFMSFEKFSSLVDEALITLETILTNANIEKYISEKE